MYKTGHYGSALLAFAPVAFTLVYLQFYIPTIIAGVIIVGCTRIPDWDMWFPGLKHRGITHTVLFALFFGLWTGGGLVLAFYLLSDFTAYYIGYEATERMLLKAGLFGSSMGVVSILAHLLADVITPTGIKPLDPFKDKRYRFPLTNAASPAGNIIFFALGAGSLLGAVAAAVYLNGTLELIKEMLPFVA